MEKKLKEWKAELENGKLKVKAVVEKTDKKTTIHLPSLKLQEELIQEYGKRNL